MAESHREHLSTSAMITFNEDNYQRQYYFTFPYPVTRHIFINANAKTQLKLRQTCKFFHKMNPMVILENLVFGHAPSQFAGKYDLTVQNFDEMPTIEVVTNKIVCYTYDKRLMTKIRRCEAKAIWVRECELSIEEFHFFTQSDMIQEWCSSEANIRDVNGKHISLENLLLRLPNAERVRAKAHDVTHGNSSKIPSWNNKIKHLALEFYGPINVDQLYELLKKVLAPKARLLIDLKNKTFLPTFKAEMKAKMKTWRPHNAKPDLAIF